MEQLQTENSAAGGLSDLTDVLAVENKMRRISYVCPVCCASMIETEAMEQERLSEIERLQEAVDFLVAALKRVQSRPGVESAFIAAVNLEHAHKVYGVKIETP